MKVEGAIGQIENKKVLLNINYNSYYSIVSYRIGVKWSLHALTQNVDYKAFPSENNFAVTTVTLSHHLTYYVTVGLHEMLNVTAKRI